MPFRASFSFAFHKSLLNILCGELYFTVESGRGLKGPPELPQNAINYAP
jgi:hypothetical protein